MEQDNFPERGHVAGRRLIGLLFILIAAALLIKQTGYYNFPAWLFTWPMILVVMGLFSGIKHRFRNFGWLGLILIGFLFLSDNIWPGMNLKQYAVPAVLAIFGLIFIFRPKNSNRCFNRNNRFRQKMAERYARRHPGFQNPFAEQAVPDGGTSNVATAASASPENAAINQDAYIDVVSVFSGVKKKILSKQFTGGDIVCFFGGAEINLTNADFKSPIVLELTQIFGGTKLIVPSNWELRSEVSAIFGGIDDKRPQPTNTVPEKTVILKGTVFCGGIEINSF